MSMYQMPRPVETPSYSKRYASVNTDSGFAMARTSAIREETRVREARERAEAERIDKANAEAQIRIYSDRIAAAQAQQRALQVKIALAGASSPGAYVGMPSGLSGRSLDAWMSQGAPEQIINAPAGTIAALQNQINGLQAQIAETQRLQVEAELNRVVVSLPPEKRKELLLASGPKTEQDAGRVRTIEELTTLKAKAQAMLTGVEVAPTTGRAKASGTPIVVVEGNRYASNDPALKKIAPDKYIDSSVITPPTVAGTITDRVVVGGQTYRKDDPKLKELAPDQYVTPEALARSLRKAEDVKIVTVGGRDYRDDDPILKGIAPSLYAYAGLLVPEAPTIITVGGNRYNIADPTDIKNLEKLRDEGYGFSPEALSQLSSVGDFKQQRRGKDIGADVYQDTIAETGYVTIEGNRYAMDDPKILGILATLGGRAGVVSNIQIGDGTLQEESGSGHLELIPVTYVVTEDGRYLVGAEFDEYMLLHPATPTKTTAQVIFVPPPVITHGSSQPGLGSGGGAAGKSAADMTAEEIADAGGVTDAEGNTSFPVLDSEGHAIEGASQSEPDSFDAAYVTTDSEGVETIHLYGFHLDERTGMQVADNGFTDSLHPNQTNINGHWVPSSSKVATLWAEATHPNETNIGGNWFSNNSMVVKKFNAAVAQNNAKIAVNKILTMGQPIMGLLGGKPHLALGIMSAEDIATAKATGSGEVFERIMANPLVIKDEDHKTDLLNWAGEPIYVYDDPVTGATLSDDPAGLVLDERTGKYVETGWYLESKLVPEYYVAIGPPTDGKWDVMTNVQLLTKEERANLPEDTRLVMEYETSGGVIPKVANSMAAKAEWVKSQKTAEWLQDFRVTAYADAGGKLPEGLTLPADQLAYMKMFPAGDQITGDLIAWTSCNWEFSKGMKISEATRILSEAGLAEEAIKGLTLEQLKNDDIRQAISIVHHNEDLSAFSQLADMNAADKVWQSYIDSGAITGSDEDGWSWDGVPLNDIRNNPEVKNAFCIKLPNDNYNKMLATFPSYLDDHSEVTEVMQDLIDTQGLRAVSLFAVDGEGTDGEHKFAKMKEWGLIPPQAVYVGCTGKMEMPSDADLLESGFLAGEEGRTQWADMVKTSGGDYITGYPIWCLHKGALSATQIETFAHMTLQQIKEYDGELGAISTAALGYSIGRGPYDTSGRISEAARGDWGADEWKETAQGLLDAVDNDKRLAMWDSLSYETKREVLGSYYIAPEGLSGIAAQLQENLVAPAMTWALDEQMPFGDVYVGTKKVAEEEPSGIQGIPGEIKGASTAVSGWADEGGGLVSFLKHLVSTPVNIALGLAVGATGMTLGVAGMVWGSMVAGFSWGCNINKGWSFANKFAKTNISIALGMVDFVLVALPMDISKYGLAFGVGEAAGSFGTPARALGKVPGFRAKYGGTTWLSEAAIKPKGPTWYNPKGFGTGTLNAMANAMAPYKFTQPVLVGIPTPDALTMGYLNAVKNSLFPTRLGASAIGRTDIARVSVPYKSQEETQGVMGGSMTEGMESPGRISFTIIHGELAPELQRGGYREIKGKDTNGMDVTFYEPNGTRLNEKGELVASRLETASPGEAMTPEVGYEGRITVAINKPNTGNVLYQRASTKSNEGWSQKEIPESWDFIRKPNGEIELKGSGVFKKKIAPDGTIQRIEEMVATITDGKTSYSVREADALRLESQFGKAPVWIGWKFDKENYNPEIYTGDRVGAIAKGIILVELPNGKWAIFLNREQGTKEGPAQKAVRMKAMAGLVGGKWEIGETAVGCVAREMMEEINVPLKNAVEVPSYMAMIEEHQYNGVNIVIAKMKWSDFQGMKTKEGELAGHEFWQSGRELKDCPNGLKDMISQLNVPDGKGGYITFDVSKIKGVNVRNWMAEKDASWGNRVETGRAPTEAEIDAAATHLLPYDAYFGNMKTPSMMQRPEHIFHCGPTMDALMASVFDTIQVLRGVINLDPVLELKGRTNREGLFDIFFGQRANYQFTAHSSIAKAQEMKWKNGFVYDLAVTREELATLTELANYPRAEWPAQLRKMGKIAETPKKSWRQQVEDELTAKGGTLTYLMEATGVMKAFNTLHSTKYWTEAKPTRESLVINAELQKVDVAIKVLEVKEATGSPLTPVEVSLLAQYRVQKGTLTKKLNIEIAKTKTQKEIVAEARLEKVDEAIKILTDKQKTPGGITDAEAKSLKKYRAENATLLKTLEQEKGKGGTWNKLDPSIAKYWVTNPMTPQEVVNQLPREKVVNWEPEVNEKFIGILDGIKNDIQDNPTKYDILKAIDIAKTEAQKALGKEGANAKINDGLEAVKQWVIKNMPDNPTKGDVAGAIDTLVGWFTHDFSDLPLIFHKVVFDMDGTLLTSHKNAQGVEIFTLRPYALEILNGLMGKGKEVALWTHSPEARTLEALRQTGLIMVKNKKGERISGYFDVTNKDSVRSREDYCPLGTEPVDFFKDFTQIKGDILIDDNKSQVKQQKTHGNQAIKISKYRGGESYGLKELYAELYPASTSAKLAKALMDAFQPPAMVQPKKTTMFNWGELIPVICGMSENVKSFMDMERDGGRFLEGMERLQNWADFYFPATVSKADASASADIMKTLIIRKYGEKDATDLGMLAVIDRFKNAVDSSPNAEITKVQIASVLQALRADVMENFIPPGGMSKLKPATFSGFVSLQRGTFMQKIRDIFAGRVFPRAFTYSLGGQVMSPWATEQRSFIMHFIHGALPGEPPRVAEATPTMKAYQNGIVVAKNWMGKRLTESPTRAEISEGLDKIPVVVKQQVGDIGDISQNAVALKEWVGERLGENPTKQAVLDLMDILGTYYGLYVAKEFHTTNDKVTLGVGQNGEVILINNNTAMELKNTGAELNEAVKRWDWYSNNFLTADAVRDARIRYMEAVDKAIIEAGLTKEADIVNVSGTSDAVIPKVRFLKSEECGNVAKFNLTGDVIKEWMKTEKLTLEPKIFFVPDKVAASARINGQINRVKVTDMAGRAGDQTVIVLPESISTADLRDVVTHETAHLVNIDWTGKSPERNLFLFEELVVYVAVTGKFLLPYEQFARMVEAYHSRGKSFRTLDASYREATLAADKLGITLERAELYGEKSNPVEPQYEKIRLVDRKAVDSIITAVRVKRIETWGAEKERIVGGIPRGLDFIWEEMGKLGSSSERKYSSGESIPPLTWMIAFNPKSTQGLGGTFARATGRDIVEVFKKAGIQKSDGEDIIARKITETLSESAKQDITLVKIQKTESGWATLEGAEWLKVASRYGIPAENIKVGEVIPDISGAKTQIGTLDVVLGLRAEPSFRHQVGGIRKVVFDMDGTLICSYKGKGKPEIHYLRPHAVELINKLMGEGKEVAIWTHSPRERTREALRQTGLDKLIYPEGHLKAGEFVFDMAETKKVTNREDYCPNGEKMDTFKDISKIGGDVLVDDLGAQITKQGEKGILITSYKGGKSEGLVRIGEQLAKKEQELRGGYEFIPLGIPGEGGRISPLKKGVVIEKQDPVINVNKDISIKDSSGKTVVLPEGEAYTPNRLSDGKVLLQDGVAIIVNKGTYEGHLLKEHKKDIVVEGKVEKFAPELEQFNEIQLNAPIRDSLGFRKGGIAGQAKYERITLPGGSNYREILLQNKSEIPTTPVNFTKEELEARDFKFQSYKGEDGREGVIFYRLGIRGGGETIHWSMKDAIKSANSILAEEGVSSRTPSPHWTDQIDIFAHLRVDERMTTEGKPVLFIEEIQSDQSIAFRRKPTQIFDHPLLKKWDIVTLKRALEEAVRTNSEFLSWTTGIQQGKMESLGVVFERVTWKTSIDGESKPVRELKLYEETGDPIGFIVNADGTFKLPERLYVRTNGRVGRFEGKPLSEAVGKNLAERVLKEEQGDLVGEQLLFGGGWAKNLYDNRIANVLKDITGEPIVTIEIKAPEIRDADDPQDSRYIGKSYTKEELKAVWDATPKKDWSEFHRDVRYEVERIIDQMGKEGRSFETTVLDRLEGMPERLKGDFKGILKKLGGEVVLIEVTTQQAIRITPELRAKVLGTAPEIRQPMGARGEEQASQGGYASLSLGDRLAEVRAEIRVLEDKVIRREGLTKDEALSLPKKYAERDALVEEARIKESEPVTEKAGYNWEFKEEMSLKTAEKILEEQGYKKGKEFDYSKVTDKDLANDKIRQAIKTSHPDIIKALERRARERTRTTLDEEARRGERRRGEEPMEESVLSRIQAGERKTREGEERGLVREEVTGRGEEERAVAEEAVRAEGGRASRGGRGGRGETPPRGGGSRGGEGRPPSRGTGYPPVKKTPVLIKKPHGGKVLTRAELEASIAWKQGMMYKLIYPPYGQGDIINSRVPFPGMHIHTGARSAFATLIRTQKGRLPSTIVRDMGMMHIRIEGGSRSTTSKPKMRFHEREERRGKGAVKAKESNTQAMTKV